MSIYSDSFTSQHFLNEQSNKIISKETKRFNKKIAPFKSLVLDDTGHAEAISSISQYMSVASSLSALGLDNAPDYVAYLKAQAKVASNKIKNSDSSEQVISYILGQQNDEISKRLVSLAALRGFSDKRAASIDSARKSLIKTIGGGFNKKASSILMQYDEVDKVNFHKTLSADYTKLLEISAEYKPTQTTSQFFSKVTNSVISFNDNNNSATSVSRVKTGLKAMEANGGTAVFMDLETLGSGDVTEFYGAVLSKSGNNNVQVVDGKEANVAFGLNKRSAAKYYALIDKYFNQEHPVLTGDEKSALNRLMLMSSSDSKLEKVDGVYQYTAFASDESNDMRVKTRDRLIRQLNEMIQIDEEYAKELVAFKRVDKSGNVVATANVTRAEKQILDLLQHAQNNDLPIFAHNGNRFDFPFADSFLSNTNKVSPEMARMIRGFNNNGTQVSGLGFSNQMTIDSLALVNTVEPKAKLSTEMAALLDKHNTTANTVVGLLLRAGLEGKIQEQIDAGLPSHLASNDTKNMAAAIFYNPDLFSSDKLQNIQDNVANIGDIFINTKPSIVSDIHGTGGVGFIYDEYSKTLRHFDGYETKINDRSKSVNKQFMPYPFKRDVAYGILNIQSIDVTDEFKELVGTVSDNLQGDNLFMVTMAEAGSKNTEKAVQNGFRNGSTIHYIGTQSDIEKLFGDHFRNIGSYNVSLGEDGISINDALKERFKEVTGNDFTGSQEDIKYIVSSGKFTKFINTDKVTDETKAEYSNTTFKKIEVEIKEDVPKEEDKTASEEETPKKKKTKNQKKREKKRKQKEEAEKKKQEEANKSKKKKTRTEIVQEQSYEIDDILSRSTNVSANKSSIELSQIKHSQLKSIVKLVELAQNEMAAQAKNGVTDMSIDKVLNIMLTNASYYAQGKKSGFEKTFVTKPRDIFDLFSYTFNGKKELTSHTIKKAVSSFPYFNSMFPFYKSVLDNVEANTVGFNSKQKDLFTRQVISSALSYLSNTNDIDTGKAIGFASSDNKPKTQKEANMAYINVTNLYNANHKGEISNTLLNNEKILQIDILENSNEYFGSKVSDIYGMDSEGGSNAKALKLFAEHLGVKLSSEEKKINNEQYLQDKIREYIRDKRQSRPKIFRQKPYGNKVYGLFNFSDDIKPLEGIAEETIDDAVKKAVQSVTYLNVEKKEQVSNKQLTRTIVDDILFKENQRFIMSKGDIKNKTEQYKSAIKELTEVYGHSQQIAEDMIHAVNQRRKDTYALIASLVKTISPSGVQFVVDPNKGTIMLENEAAQVVDITSKLPFDVFSKTTGSMYSRIGNQNVANPMSLWTDDNSMLGKLHFTSMTAKAQSKSQYKLGFMDYSDSDEVIRKTLGFFREFRENMSIYAINTSDAEESLLSRRIDISSGIYDNLVNYYNKGVFNNLFEENKELNEVFSDLSINYSKNKEYSLSDNQQKIISANFAPILQSIISNSKDLTERERRFFRSANLRMHHIDRGYINSVREYSSAFDWYGQDKRHMTSVINHSLRMNTDAYEEAAKRIYGSLDDMDTSIQYGSGINTKRGYLLEQKDGIERAIRVQRLTLSTSGSSKILSDEDNIKYAYYELNKKYNTDLGFLRIRDKLTGVYLDENSAVASPLLLDLATNNSVQKVKLSDVTEETNKWEAVNGKGNGLLKSFLSGVNIDDDGNIILSNDPVDFVRKGEVIGKNKNFQNGTESIRARDEGVLSLNFVDKTEKTTADLKTVEALLNSPESKERINNAIKAANDDAHKELARNYEISQILNDRFRIEFHLTPSDAQDYRKTIESREKSMTSFLLAGLGEVDVDIRNTLEIAKEKAGLKTSITGRKFSTDFLLTAADDDGVFWKMFDKPHQAANTVKEAFGGDLNSFVQHALKERTAYWDAYMNVMKHGGAISESDNIAFVSNTLAEREKHKEVSAYLQPIINTIVEDKTSDIMKSGSAENVYEAKKQAINSTIEEFNKAGVFNKKNVLSLFESDNHAPQILLSEDANKANIDVLALDKVIKDNNLKERHFKTLSNGVEVETGTGIINFAADINRGSEKFKYTERVESNLFQQFYDKESLSKSYDALAKLYGSDVENLNARFNELYGHVARVGANGIEVIANQTPINQKLSEYLKGSVFLGSNNTQMKYSVKAVLDENGLVVKGEKDIKYKVRDSILVDHKQNLNTEAYEELVRRGVPEDHILSISKNLIASAGDSYKGLSSEAVANTYAFNTFEMAVQLNDLVKNVDSTPEEVSEKILQMQKTGFTAPIKITDIDATQGYNAGNPNSLFGNPMIVDMGDSFEKLGGQRYVAFGYDMPKFLDDENTIELRKEIQKQVGILKYNALDLEELQEQASSDNTTIAATATKRISSKVDSMISGVENLQSSVRKMLHGKDGIIYRTLGINLDNSGQYKASTLRIGNGETNTYLDHVYIGRRNLGAITLNDAAKKGVNINAIFVNEDFINKTYSKDIEQIAKVFGFSSQKLRTRINSVLEYGGTNAVGIRFPSVYEGSIASAKMFFHKDVASDEMKFTEAMAAAMKMDNDGDNISVHVAKQLARISDENGLSIDLQIDSATASVLERFGLDVDFGGRDRLFTEMDAASLTHSSTILQYYKDKISKSLSDTSIAKKNDAGEVISTYDVLENGLSDNVFNNTISTTDYSVKERQQLHSAFAEVAENAGIEVDDRLNPTVIKQQGEAYLQTLIDNGTDKSEVERTANVLGYGFNVAREIEESSAKWNQSSVGLVNYNTNQIRLFQNNMISHGYVPNFTSSQSTIVNKVLQGIEDNFMASKNAEHLGSNVVQEIGRAVNSFFSNNIEKRDEFFKFIFDDFDILSMKEMSQTNNQAILDYQSALKSGADNIAELRANAENVVRESFKSLLPDTFKVSSSFRQAYRAGYAKNADNVEMMMISNGEYDANNPSNTMREQFFNAIKNYNEDLGSNNLIPEKDLGYFDLNEQYKETVNTKISKGYSGATNNAPLNDLVASEGRVFSAAADAIERSVNNLSKLKGTGALAGLGLAFGIMGAGFIGGDPSTPSDNIARTVNAQQMRNNDSFQTGVAGDYDNSAAVSQPAPQGYIIHVNGTTDRGAEVAQSMINQAFSSSFGRSQNINMTMNIKNDPGNISNRDILQHISDLL